MKRQLFTNKLKEKFKFIFKNTNPFGKMFTNNVDKKNILCPTDGYYLNKKQFAALQSTLEQLNESSFYLCVTEDETFNDKIQTDNPLNCGPWELSRNISYDEYKQLPLILENALFSKNGSWGIIISHEDHAVIGGSDSAIMLFRKFYPAWQNEQTNFLELWKENATQYKSNTSWIHDFINYINS